MKILKKLIKRMTFNSKGYWEKRYSNCGNSGIGSYGKYAIIKADFLNDFVKLQNIERMIDFGCGDGNVASYLRVNNYIGLDVSKTAINICKDKFEGDYGKEFFVYNKFSDIEMTIKKFDAELAISLDVIFHLVENKIFKQYIEDLFKMSSKYIIIYSTNFSRRNACMHQIDREFTLYIHDNIKSWRLRKQYQNPIKDENTESDFYLYEKVS